MNSYYSKRENHNIDDETDLEIKNFKLQTFSISGEIFVVWV